MGFAEDIAKLSEQIRPRSENVFGEEATKQALILPFFSALGYDVWEPREVQPEYVSDAAKKKSGQFERVDYAIAVDQHSGQFLKQKLKPAFYRCV